MLDPPIVLLYLGRRLLLSVHELHRDRVFVEHPAVVNVALVSADLGHEAVK
jgi:hypothetical protein